MDDITADINTKVATDCSRCGFLRVCCTDHLADNRHDIAPFPYHEEDRPSHDILLEGGEEGVCEMFLVLVGNPRFGQVLEPGCNKLQTFLLEPGYDLAHKTTLDTVGFDHD